MQLVIKIEDLVEIQKVYHGNYKVYCHAYLAFSDDYKEDPCFNFGYVKAQEVARLEGLVPRIKELVEIYYDSLPPEAYGNKSPESSS